MSYTHRCKLKRITKVNKTVFISQADRKRNSAWLFNLKFRKVIFRTIAGALLLSFVSNNACYGLATLPASQNPITKREILATLQRTQVRYAESEDAKRLLEANNASCLLLSSGKYLVTKEIAENDLKLLRAIIHEDIEAIMQILAKEERPKYQGIKELILKYFPPNKDDNLPIDLYVNHTVARAFEWLVPMEDNVIFKDDISSQDLRFINAIKPMIMANRYSYFGGEFWDAKARGEKIKIAINNGKRFYQVANNVDNGEGKDIIDKLAKFIGSYPDFDIKDYASLAKRTEHSRTLEHKYEIVKNTQRPSRQSGSGKRTDNAKHNDPFEGKPESVSRYRDMVEDFMMSEPPLPESFGDTIPRPGDAHVRFYNECKEQEMKIAKYLDRAYELIPFLKIAEARTLESKLAAIEKNTKDFFYDAGGGHYGDYSYDDIRNRIKKIRARLASEVGQEKPLTPSLYSYKTMVCAFMAENKDFEDIASGKVFHNLYSPDGKTRGDAFRILCKDGDERLTPLLIAGLIVELNNPVAITFPYDPPMTVFDYKTEEMMWPDGRGGHYPLLTVAKINILRMLFREIEKSNPSVAKSIKRSLKNENTDIRVVAVETLRNLRNIAVFQPLIDAEVAENFLKDIFLSIRLADKDDVAELMKQEPALWQPPADIERRSFWDKDVREYLWPDEEVTRCKSEYPIRRKEAIRYLIAAYQIISFLTEAQKGILGKRLDVLMKTAKDFHASYQRQGAPYHDSGGAAIESFNGEYVDIRDLIAKVKMRLLPGSRKLISEYYRSIGIIDLDDINKDDVVGNKARSFMYFKKLSLEFPKGVAITKHVVKEIAEGNADLLDMITAIIGDRMNIHHHNVSVRSSPEVSMPGQLATVLDVGEKSGLHPFTDNIDNLKCAILKVATSWNSPSTSEFRKLNGIPDDFEQGIIVQRMVWGDRSDDSGTGVAYSRDPDTGKKRLCGSFALKTSGESLVTEGRGGSPLNEMEAEFPEQYKKLGRALRDLERVHGFPQEVEFTIDRGGLYFLQTRDMRFPPDIEMKILKERLAKDITAVVRLEKLQAKMNRRKMYQFDAHGEKFKPLFESGSFLRGAMAGFLVFSVKKAKELAGEGKSVILVEIPGAPGILEAIYSINRIGLISKRYQNTVCHGAILARSEGIPCVMDPPGVEIKDKKLLYGDGGVLAEGDYVVIADGKVYGSDIFSGGKDENYYLKETTQERFRPFGIDIDKYRKRFRADYLSRDPKDPIISYQTLLALNVENLAKVEDALRTGDEEAICRLNLEKHYLHELLSEKGKGLGKTENEIRKDFESELRDNSISIADKEEKKREDEPRLSASGIPSYDSELATVLLSDLLYAQLQEGRTYEIKYDVSRLSPSQAEIIEEYTRLLQARSGDPDNIRLKPFSSTQGSKESLIAVYCSGKGFKGEGHVDVSIPEGDIGDYLLKITGMLNMAIASANIPDNLSKEDVDKYRPILSYINNQYKAILGESLAIPDSPEEILKVIRRIVLGLPKSMRMNLGQIEEFNRLAKQALTAA